MGEKLYDLAWVAYQEQLPEGVVTDGNWGRFLMNFTLRAVRDALLSLEAECQRNRDWNFLGTMESWFEKGGPFEVKDE